MVSDRFIKARSVFSADIDAKDMHVGVRQYGYHSTFNVDRSDENCILRISGRHLLRVYINGIIAYNGPARSAHGYARIEETDICKYIRKGINHIAVEMCVYGDVYAEYSNDSTLEIGGFLLCEIDMGGEILTYTGDGSWKSCVISSRATVSPRISHCREASEIYTLNGNDMDWVYGEGIYGLCDVLIVKDPKLIPRNSLTPKPEYVPFKRIVSFGGAVMSGSEDINKFFYDKGTSYSNGYYEKITEHPEYDCMMTRDISKSNISLTRANDKINIYAQSRTDSFFVVLESLQNTSGYVHVKFSCEFDGIVDVVRSEIMHTDGSIPHYYNNVMRLHVAAGMHDITAMEAGVAKYLKIYFRNTGNVILYGSGMITCEYNDNSVSCFSCSDKKVESIYDAARRTLLCNTFDVFMDCPDRERGGWSCDSLWTARAASLILGDTRIEKDHLENQLLTDSQYMYRGFFPDSYPSSRSNYSELAGITTWSFYLMCEMCEYIKRSADIEFAKKYEDRVKAFVEGSRMYIGDSGLLEDLPCIFIDWSLSNKDEYKMPISTPANALYAYMLCQLGAIYKCDEWITLGESIRSILKEAIKNASDGGRVTVIPDSFVNDNGTLHSRGNATESGIATCLWSELYRYDECKELFNNFRDSMGVCPKYAKDPMISESQLFIGLCIRLDVLSKFGYINDLYRELQAIYLPQLYEGPGTLWESRLIDTTSRCHGFNAHAAVHLIRDILGIHEPDMMDRKVDICPHISDLRWASGSVETRFGVISVSWRYNEETFFMDIHVPNAYKVDIQIPKEVKMLDDANIEIYVNGVRYENI